MSDNNHSYPHSSCGEHHGCGDNTNGHGCGGNCETCGEDCKNRQSAEDLRMREEMGRIKHKIVVMSGKGGVGKSTVAVNLAFALAAEGRSVGLLDVDIHGPSVPRMLHLEDMKLMSENNKVLPVEIGTLKVVSIAFMLQNPDDGIIWRGPLKIGVIRQFLADVAWGDLDYLIIDTPPGTGDEPLSVCQFIPDASGAVIVTTPQEVAAADVRKSVNFCRQLNFPVLGIVENMSGFVCPKCGEVTEIFAGDAGAKIAQQFCVPLLGKIPVDPTVCAGGDAGRPFIQKGDASPTAKAFRAVIEPILNLG